MFFLEGIRNAFCRSHPLQKPVSSHLQNNILCCIFNLSDVTKCIEDFSVTSHCMFSFSTIFTWRATTAVCLLLCGAQRQCWKIELGDWSVSTIKIAPKPGSGCWKLDHHLGPEWIGRKEGNLSRSEILTKWAGTLVVVTFTKRPCFWIIKLY